MPMKDDRLRAARLCRVLTQRSLLGASRFLRFRSVRRLELLPRSIFHGVTSFQTLAGLVGIFFYFVLPGSLIVELVCQGPLEVSLRESERRTLNRLTRIRAKFEARSTT